MSTLQASLHDCLLNLWPKLRHEGSVYIDEYVLVDYSAVFFSERYWRTYFDTTPPGLFGSGRGHPDRPVLPRAVPRTRRRCSRRAASPTRIKDNSGYWDYYPEDPGGDGPDEAPERPVDVDAAVSSSSKPGGTAARTALDPFLAAGVASGTTPPRLGDERSSSPAGSGSVRAERLAPVRASSSFAWTRVTLRSARARSRRGHVPLGRPDRG